MKEAIGNLWQLAGDVRVITTNGSVTSAGHAVMGRGTALDAKRLYPKIPRLLGYFIETKGNHVYELVFPDGPAGFSVVSFPTKHEVSDTKADLQLIIQSAMELRELVDDMQQRRGRALSVLLPRPGCGAGQREWHTEVKPLLAPLLNDQYTAISLTP